MLSALKQPDKNPFIAKKQAALRKSFTSWKQDKSLDGAHDLAWYFYAAGNSKAARSIVDEIADNVVSTKSGDRSWGSAANAICAAARFAREAKDKKRAAVLIQRIRETPAHLGTENRAYVVDVIRRYKDQLVAAPKEKRAETACAYAANSLVTFVYYAETLRHGGFPYDKWLDRAEIDRMMADAIEVIATRMKSSPK